MYPQPEARLSSWSGLRRTAILLCTIALASCGPRAPLKPTQRTKRATEPPQPGPAQAASNIGKKKRRQQRCDPHLDVKDTFLRHRVRGVFVLRNEQDGCIRTSDQAMANTPFRPQSTFKIPHAMIGLETGAIPGPDHVWIWDKEPRSNPLWEQDLSLKQALNLSCVPCFRSLAREIGADRMRQFMEKMDYGNKDISGPIDLFWLTGALRITPIGQTQFVHRSLHGELPIKKNHVDLVWNDLEQAPQGNLRLFPKTGLGEQNNLAIGWTVGFLQRGAQRWSFATFIQSPAGENPSIGMSRLRPLRLKITREIVKMLKLETQTSN